jgi:hypothetical protein
MSLPPYLANSWLGGPFPKVGVVATIDGRYRGVRESLEGQCAAMVKRSEPGQA